MNSSGWFQTAVVTEKRNLRVLAEKTQDIGHGAFRLTKCVPQIDRALDRAGEQLTKGKGECGDSCGENTPRPLEAAGLDDFGRRVGAFRRKPGPLIEIRLEPVRLWRAVRHMFGGEDREGEPANLADVALDYGSIRTLGLAIAPVASVTVGMRIVAALTDGPPAVE